MNKIESYKAIDYSNRKITRLLRRNPQTIHNAIKERVTLNMGLAIPTEKEILQVAA